MKSVKNKFFIFNPKSYLFGDELLELAKEADCLAERFPEISIFVTCPYADISRVANETKHIIVTAQHWMELIVVEEWGLYYQHRYIMLVLERLS